MILPSLLGGIYELVGIAAVVILVVYLLRNRKTTDQSQSVPQEQTGLIAQGIRNNAGSYDGLYEGLYQAVKNPQPLCTDAYQEWCDRVAQCPDPAFREAFASRFRKEDISDEQLCLQKCRQLLTLVNEAGIQRERENNQTCTADENLCKYYCEVTGQKPQSGVSYQIIKSAWTMDGKVVEYGMVMRINC